MMYKYTKLLVATQIVAGKTLINHDQATSFLKPNRNPRGIDLPFIGNGAEVLDKGRIAYSTQIAKQLKLINVEAYEDFTEHLERRISNECVDRRRRKDGSKDARWGCGRKDDLKLVRSENDKFEECVSECSEQDERDDWKGYAYEENLEAWQAGKLKAKPQLPCLQCIEKLPKKFVINQFRGTGKGFVDVLDSVFNFGKEQSFKEVISDLGNLDMPWEV